MTTKTQRLYFLIPDDSAARDAAKQFLRSWGIEPVPGRDEEGDYLSFSRPADWTEEKARAFATAYRVRVAVPSDPDYPDKILASRAERAGEYAPKPLTPETVARLERLADLAGVDCAWCGGRHGGPRDFGVRSEKELADLFEAELRWYESDPSILASLEARDAGWLLAVRRLQSGGEPHPVRLLMVDDSTCARKAHDEVAARLRGEKPLAGLPRTRLYVLPRSAARHGLEALLGKEARSLFRDKERGLDFFGAVAVGGAVEFGAFYAGQAEDGAGA